MLDREGEVPMCGDPGNDQALVTELQKHVTAVQALFRESWKRGGSHWPRRLGRIVLGTNPRSRYARAEALIVLRDALTELILTAEGSSAISELQRWRMKGIGQEIDKWPSPATGTQAPEHKIPSIEELWQIVCDVECLTIEVADDRWLTRRWQTAGSTSPADDRPVDDKPGRDGPSTSPETKESPRDMDCIRHELLDASRRRVRSNRQRRADERVRAERLMSAGALAFPAAVFTAGFFSWAVYWQGGAPSGLGYVLVRSALAVAAGALGGGLARLLRLRDAPLGTLEADRFRRAFIVQMLQGGALGVVALVLVLLGALPRVGNGGEVEMVALYAFLAGWSEPFILGVLDRLGSGDRRRATD